MHRTISVGVAVMFVGVAAVFSQRALDEPSGAQRGANTKPIFQVDSTWFKIPNNWVIGNVAAVAVDKSDQVWVLHRPRVGVPADTKGGIAPPVMEFDADGKFLRAWGGKPDGACDWVGQEHGMYVDNKDNVWFVSTQGSIVHNSRSDDFVGKWTTSGKCVMQIGKPDANKTPRDTTNVHGAADVFVYPTTNEVFVADEGNLRVVVFNADTGAFKRMWGAFGDPPPEQRLAELPSPVTTGPGPRTFSNPHHVRVSDDGLVYVSDRVNRRIQVFTLAGKYMTQVFINRSEPRNPAALTAGGVAFSRDPEQRFLYVTDYSNSEIVVLQRKTLNVVYKFGQRGADPGQFQGIHQLAVDSKNNLYVSEVGPGNRVQKFVFKGLVPAP